MMEKTLVLLKPDAVLRGIVGEILTRFERCGLKMVGLKLVYANEQQAGEHYADDEEWLKSVGEKTLKGYEKRGIKLDKTALEQGQLVRRWLMNYLTMSPIVALCLEGHNAVGKVRTLCGPTAPSDSAPGTIRGDYAIDSFMLGDKLERPIQNLIHASGAVDEAEREIKIWFEKDELHAWKRIDEGLFYRKGEEKPF